MKEAILVALEVYYMGFIISILIAALIKGIQLVIRRFTPQKGAKIEGKEAAE